MRTFVALLRGVNVGGNNKLPMADLRVALEDAGFGRVRTYIQSGNVVLEHRKASDEAVAAHVRSVVLSAFGLDIPTVVVTSQQLESIAAANPFSHEPDPKRVHVFFLPDELDAASRASVEGAQSAAAAKGSADTVTVRGRVMYLHTPDGFGVSDLAKSLSTRGAGAHRAGTARNWATVSALLAMVRG